MNGEPGPAKLGCLLACMVGLVLGIGGCLVLGLMQSEEDKERSDQWQKFESRVRMDLVDLLRKDRQAFQRKLDDLRQKGNQADEVSAMRDAMSYDEEVRSSRAGTMVLIAIAAILLLVVWYVSYRVMKVQSE